MIELSERDMMLNYYIEMGRLSSDVESFLRELRERRVPSSLPSEIDYKALWVEQLCWLQQVRDSGQLKWPIAALMNMLDIEEREHKARQ